MNNEWVEDVGKLLKRAGLEKDASICIVLALAKDKEKQEERANELIDFLIQNPKASEEEIVGKLCKILGFPVDDE